MIFITTYKHIILENKIFDSEFYVLNNLTVDLIEFDENSRKIGKRKECFCCFDEIFYA